MSLFELTPSSVAKDISSLLNLQFSKFKLINLNLCVWIIMGNMQRKPGHISQNLKSFLLWILMTINILVFFCFFFFLLNISWRKVKSARYNYLLF